MKKKYFNLKVIATQPNTDIWLSDDKGFLVVKGDGMLDEGLLPGRYFVEFGLGNKKHLIILNNDMEYRE